MDLTNVNRLAFKWPVAYNDANLRCNAQLSRTVMTPKWYLRKRYCVLTQVPTLLHPPRTSASQSSYWTESLTQDIGRPKLATSHTLYWWYYCLTTRILQLWYKPTSHITAAGYTVWRWWKGFTRRYVTGRYHHSPNRQDRSRMEYRNQVTIWEAEN